MSETHLVEAGVGAGAHTCMFSSQVRPLLLQVWCQKRKEKKDFSNVKPETNRQKIFLCEVEGTQNF